MDIPTDPLGFTESAGLLLRPYQAPPLLAMVDSIRRKLGCPS